MFHKAANIFPAIISSLSFLLLISCRMFDAKGIPVKVFQESAPVQELDVQKPEVIAAMSQVAGNSVFTERNGIPEYIIGPGDVVTINLWEGAKNNSYDCLVRPDGKVSYLYLDNIKLTGLTANEANQLITEALKKYIREPRIEIIVKEFRSKSALLFGQINVLQTGISGPGKYPLKGKTSILDLIVMAGGPITGRGGSITGRETFAAGQNADLQNVELIRKGKRYVVNLYNTMFTGDGTQNVIIDDGDIISVPEMSIYGEKVYVFGEINNQGIYKLRDASDLLAAIALAGGTTHVAVKSDIKIIRGYREKQRQPIILAVNLEDILNMGDLPQNVKLQKDDVVYVPRTVIGDVNEFIINTVPLLDYLLYPSEYKASFF